MHFIVNVTLTENLVKAVLLMQITKPSSSTKKEQNLSPSQIYRAVNFSGLCIWKRGVDHNMGVQNASLS